MEKTTNRKRSIREKNETLKTKNCNAVAIDREVLLIDDELLMSKKAIDKFSKNIKEEREKTNVPQSVVAEFMDISQTSISHYERLNEKKISAHLRAIKTRREYLKAFALAYNVSPFYLIGLQHRPMPFTFDKDFIDSNDGLIDPFSFMIVMKLYNESDKKIINNFERICFISEEKRENIKTLIRSMPAINVYIDTERSNLTNEFYEELNDFLIKHERACTYKEIRSYVRSFECLRREDEHTYYMIANLVLNINDDLKKVTSDFIKIAGYVSL